MSFRWLFQQSALLYKSLHLELYNEMPRLHHFWAGVCLPADDFTVTIHTIYSSTLAIIHPSTCRRNSKRGPWLAREVKCTKTRWIRPKLLLLKMVDPWPLKLNPFSWTGHKDYFLAQKCLCEVRGSLTMLYWLAGGPLGLFCLNPLCHCRHHQSGRHLRLCLGLQLA